MLNYIWIFMILISIIYSFFNGTYVETINGAIVSATDTISLLLTLLASMCFFNGMLKIAEKSGVTDIISKWFNPLLKKLFPNLSKNDQAFSSMSMNITANLLGMGNAATPLGIETMKRLQKNNKSNIRATNEMCLFAVLNTSSIQLIPSTIIALRMNYGSLEPFSIVVPIWISSFVALVIGIVAAKYFKRSCK